MVRMGHDSQRAALIYLHSSDKRQRALAATVAEAFRAELAQMTLISRTDLARGWHETVMTVRKTRAGERIRTADRPLTRSIALSQTTSVL